MGHMLLADGELQAYTEAILKTSLKVGRGDTLVVKAELAHRALAVALAETAYRLGADIAEVVYHDTLATRARMLHGRRETLGLLPP